MAELYARLFGDEVANELHAPYVFGDTDQLLSLFKAAGIADPEVFTQAGTARFESIDDWVDLDVKGWTLAELIGDDGHELVKREARVEMQRFVQDDGSVAFSSPAHIVTARQD